MTKAIAGGLTPQEEAFFLAICFTGESEEFDEFTESLSTARAMDDSPMNHYLKSIIVDRFSRFGDGCGHRPSDENELGEFATIVSEILGLVTEEEDDYEVEFENPKNCVYSLIYGLQHQYFWGESDTPNIDDIYALFEQLKEMNNTETILISFVHMKLLEPWMEFIDEGIEQGIEPCDDYKEWCDIVAKIKEMDY